MSDEVDVDKIKLLFDMVIQDDGELYVWKVDEKQKVVKQFVEIGDIDESDMVEIKSGLMLEDYVIYFDLVVKEGKQVIVNVDIE